MKYVIIPLTSLTINSDNITFNHLESICENGEKETLFLEFKAVSKCEVLNNTFKMKIYHEVLALMVQGGVIIFGISEKKGIASKDAFGVPKTCDITTWFNNLIEQRGLEGSVQFYTIEHPKEEREFLIVYVPKSSKLMRDPDTYDYWIRVIGNEGPKAIRINPEQLNQIFYTYDYVEDTINEIFYQNLRSIIYTIPYDAQILKQRVDFRDFLKDLEEKQNEDLINLILTNDVHYTITYFTKKDYSLNLTRFDFINYKTCECQAKCPINLYIHSNGVIEFRNEYFFHFICKFHSEELRIDLFLEDLKNFLFLVKYTYDHFAINEFELVLNIDPHPNAIRKIGTITRDKPLFRKAHLRIKMRCLEINSQNINNIFRSFFREMIRYINPEIITEQELSTELEKFLIPYS